MKIFILFSMLFLTAFSVFSQNVQPQSLKKIAFIDSLAFDDEKFGVDRLVQAYNVLGRELSGYPVSNDSKIKILEKQLESNNLSDEDRLQNLNKIFELKKENELLKIKIKENYQKRFGLIVQPVFVEIDSIVKNIGEQNNLIILKGEELDEKGQILAFDPKFNITYSLIPTINDYFKPKLHQN